MNKGLITKAIAGFYYVEAGDTVYQCKARGIFKKRGSSPLVGDNVVFEEGENDKTNGMVEELLERKNSLIRPPLANVTRLFIVSAYQNPAPNGLIIDKLIAIAEHKDIEPILIFNKSDQGDLSKWREIYEKAGFCVHVVSCESGENVDAVMDDLKDGISVFSGNSGVGKSSLINMLFRDLELPTGEVSEKLGRGRHTTRHVELFKTGAGGYVADTPGFASLDLEKSEVVLGEDLPYAFREFLPYLGKCKFTDCSHTCETGCAILDALEKGEIGRERFESYKTLYNEVKDIKKWEL